MRKWVFIFCLSLMTLGLVQAQTAPSTTATLSPREQINRDATRILAGYTATAEAFPIAREDTDDFAAAAFGLGLCSMLIIFVPLAFGVWRLNRAR